MILNVYVACYIPHLCHLLKTDFLDSIYRSQCPTTDFMAISAYWILVKIYSEYVPIQIYYCNASLICKLFIILSLKPKPIFPHLQSSVVMPLSQARSLTEDADEPSILSDLIVIGAKICCLVRVIYRDACLIHQDLPDPAGRYQIYQVYMAGPFKESRRAVR